MTTPNAAASRFVEAMGLQFDRLGGNRTLGRIIAHLMICDPAEQSAGDLETALKLSKASISTAVRTLETMGFVERAAIPGKRRIHYRLRPDAWPHVSRLRLKETEAMVALAERGMAAVADQPGDQRARIDGFREWATWWRDHFADMLAQWEREHP